MTSFKATLSIVLTFISLSAKAGVSKASPKHSRGHERASQSFKNMFQQGLRELPPIGRNNARAVVISSFTTKALRGAKAERQLLNVATKLAKANRDIEGAPRATFDGLLRAASVNKKQRDIMLDHKLDKRTPKQPLDPLFEIHAANVSAQLGLEEAQDGALPLNIAIHRSKQNRLKWEIRNLNLPEDKESVPLPYGQELETLKRVFERRGQATLFARKMFNDAQVDGKRVFKSDVNGRLNQF